MNIGYLVPQFPNQTHTFFWREVRGLRAAGADVCLLSTRRPPVDACEHDFAEDARRETRYLFPPSWGGMLSVWLRHPVRVLRAVGYVVRLRETRLDRRLVMLGLLMPAAELVRIAHLQRLEHVHVHSCAVAAHIAALARILGGPSYSLTLHGDLPVYGVDHASKMARAAFVATVTRPLKEQVTSLVGLPPDRVPVVWMGVDSDSFRPPGTRSTEAGRLHVVTIARLNRMKGHQHVLAVVRRLVDRGHDVRYTIAGEGPFRPELERAIAELDLDGCVRLVGTLSEQAVKELLESCDAFVLASVGLGEAAPVSVMEAMACGLPVVCSIIGGTPDMIVDEESGLLVEQGDESGLEEALERLVVAPDLRERIGRAARRRAVEVFDYRKMAGRLLQEIQTAARPQSSSSPPR